MPIQKYILNKASIFIIALLSVLFSNFTQASTAKFDIPGDFPGDFQIDFLATDFKLNRMSAGSLSTFSTIQFSVNSETFTDSGIYNISTDAQGFNFIGFNTFGINFDVYGAGTGTGTFDTNSGDWLLNMPTLFIYDTGPAIRVDLHLTTENIWVPDGGGSLGYWTTSASPMILDESSPEPWGNLNLVADGLTPFNDEVKTLVYDWELINSIASNYDNFYIDQNPFPGMQYEFNINGNDPLVSVSSVPVPAAIWLFGSGVIGLIGLARKNSA